MTKEEEARILDPETRADCQDGLAAIEEACAVEVRALREASDQRCIVSDKDLYRMDLSIYGADAQTVMVFEEMAELQKELCKHARGSRNRETIAEEIADVLIMLEQMMVLHDCEDSVFRYKQEKKYRLEQQLRRAERETYHHL